MNWAIRRTVAMTSMRWVCDIIVNGCPVGCLELFVPQCGAQHWHDNRDDKRLNKERKRDKEKAVVKAGHRRKGSLHKPISVPGVMSDVDYYLGMAFGAERMC